MQTQYRTLKRVRQRRGFAASHYASVRTWLVFRKGYEEGTSPLMLKLSEWVWVVVLVAWLASDDVVGVFAAEEGAGVGLS
jgi:hypothetical protein